MAGFGLYAAFTSGNNLSFYTLLAIRRGFVPQRTLYVLVFLALSVVTFAIILRRLKASQRLAIPSEMQRERFVALALLVPWTWGALEAALAQFHWTFLNTVGLWRLAGVAVIAYGLARWRVFDLPERTKRATATSVGVAGALAGGATGFGVTSLVFAGPAVPAVLGAATTLLAVVPGVRFARRLFHVESAPAPDEWAAHNLGERLDTYRAALEASLARGTLEEDRAFLAALRERFAITPDQEVVLMHYARRSVIVPRSGDAQDAYERLRLLGEGGQGRTWLVRDRVRDRLVVLKEPLASWQGEERMREHFLREARAAARVRHPNVVHLEEVVEQGGRPYLIMEYLEGGSLADVLRARGGRLSWRDALALARDLLTGLEAIHAAGIAHCDIKPSNVLLTREGRAKLADFGIAAPISSGKTLVLDEPSAMVTGTTSYMAPEVLGNRARPGRRSDVYSCAALLHECLHGVPPRGAILVDPQVPAAFQAALRKALAPDPDHRPPTARHFLEQLEKVPA